MQSKQTEIPEDLLTQVTKQVEKFLMDTEEARLASERDRDYKDHKQWTSEQAAKLKARGQAPIVVNRIKPKVEGLLGLLALRNSDPKAYPRTKKHEKSAEAITDALRFVADNNDFNDTCKMAVAEEVFVEGYGGAIVDVQQNGANEIEIRVEHIPWDRIYYDPHSRKRDFSDARYMGMIVWMSTDEVLEKFPDVDIDQLTKGNGGAYETFEDRPRWVEASKDRVRIALHFWMKEGVWHMCTFSQNTFLAEPQESPFLDDYGQPCNPIELVGAYIDRDNRRYGEVRSFIDQQDEINHRRSKALHLLSTRQTFGRKGEVKDVEALKRELAKPNGHIEFTGETFGKDFGIMPTTDMLQGQLELYQDAKNELDAISFNAQLAGERQGDLSGKAIDRLQQAGTNELNNLFTGINNWEKRIYRQIWSRIKQFWTEEKWIRVTDDQDNLRWVGLNSEVTVQEWLEEIINDKSESLVKRKKAAATFSFLMTTMDGQDMQAAAIAEEKLKQIITVKNKTVEIDVDIILDQSFDTVNVQQEQFELIAQFAKGADIDIIELIELSQLRGKDELVDKIKKRREEAAEALANQNNPQNNPVLMQKMAEIQLKAEESKQSMQLKQVEADNNIRIKNAEAANDIQIERIKAATQIEISKDKLAYENSCKTQEMEMAKAQAQPQEKEQEVEKPDNSAAIGELANVIRDVGMAFATRPAPSKQINIQTDKDGNVTGAESVG